MAAAHDSSGVGAVRPDVPQSSPDAFYRVTVDNTPVFEFPTLSGAAAFIDGYGSGDLFEVDPETGLQTPVDVVSADLSKIKPRTSSLRKRGGYFGAAYDPSREEIRQACADIRSGWSEEEHRRRAGFGVIACEMTRNGVCLDYLGTWLPPVVRLLTEASR